MKNTKCITLLPYKNYTKINLENANNIDLLEKEPLNF